MKWQNAARVTELGSHNVHNATVQVIMEVTRKRNVLSVGEAERLDVGIVEDEGRNRRIQI